MEVRKPNERTVGKHILKGLRYDKNGNPLYTSDTMSDEQKKSNGWRFSKIHGYYGQLNDPKKLHEGDLHRIIKESVNKVIKESNEIEFYRKEIASIDPDTANGWDPDFEEHPELRKTTAYKKAYRYADEMDWYVNGDDINVDYYDIQDLASDAEYITHIPKDILFRAMIDYLNNELGYEV